MTTSIEFKRALFGFSVETLSPFALDVAARIAELLRLDLLGLFLMDDTLQAAAAYSGAREYLTGSGNWRSIDLDQLQQDLALTIRSAERALAARAASRKLASSFRVLRGSAAETLQSVSLRSDILVVAEPGAASAFLTRTSGMLVEAAIHSEASVLLIPPAAVMRQGPVIALAYAPDDPSVEVASAVAAASHVPLIIVETYKAKAEGSAPSGSTAQVAVSRVSAGSALESDPGLLFGLVGRPSESLIVCTRHSGNSAVSLPRALAKSRKTPILILEPAPSLTREAVHKAEPGLPDK